MEPALVDLRRWFARRVPEAWFTGPLDVLADRDEILVVGTVPPPPLEDASEPARRAAAAARIKLFRETTREARIAIAAEAERLWGRPVSWGARCDGVERLFSAASVPVMTRLRLPERAVLDTLLEAGVARSRSEALAWCVRLVGLHESDWIAQLREAVAEIERVRARGPDLG